MTAALLHPALEILENYDRENHGELRSTLSVYLTKERNQLLASEALYIHPNTMRYRLSRIRELTGLTLEDPEELKYLEINVDVLGDTEDISSEAELDPKRYGVIVTNGMRRGLLLPNLDGVDTVAEQISIARSKAGIGPGESISLQRFEVVRHV